MWFLGGNGSTNCLTACKFHHVVLPFKIPTIWVINIFCSHNICFGQTQSWLCKHKHFFGLALWPQMLTQLGHIPLHIFLSLFLNSIFLQFPLSHTRKFHIFPIPQHLLLSCDTALQLTFMLDWDSWMLVNKSRLQNRSIVDWLSSRVQVYHLSVLMRIQCN